MSKIKFYTNPRSRGAIVRWMLEEVGADYETKVLNFGPEMKSDEYLKINPMGKVPAIQYKNQIVTECAAICAFLADLFPEKGLAPQVDQRGAYYRWMFFAAGPLEAAVSNKGLGIEVPKEKQGFVGYGNFENMVKTLAYAVSQSPFLAGEKFSAADVYVGSQIGWGLQFKTLPDLKEFTSYWARVSDREAYRQAMAKDKELES